MAALSNLGFVTGEAPGKSMPAGIISFTNLKAQLENAVTKECASRIAVDIHGELAERDWLAVPIATGRRVSNQSPLFRVFSAKVSPVNQKPCPS